VGGGLSTYTTKSGDIKSRFLQFGKSGSPDIISILPTTGRFCGVEVKVGKDKLRPEQEGFIASTRKMGGEVLVVKTYEDFLIQFNNIYNG
jgi:hypothetical protein